MLVSTFWGFSGLYFSNARTSSCDASVHSYDWLRWSNVSSWSNEFVVSSSFLTGDFGRFTGIVVCVVVISASSFPYFMGERTRRTSIY